MRYRFLLIFAFIALLAFGPAYVMAEEFTVISRPDRLTDEELIKEWTSCVL